MALTPDAIERRTFPIADWGYDRGEVHKFLVEMAAALRSAQHAVPPHVVPAPTVAATPGEPARRVDVVELIDEDGRTDSRRLSEKISQVLEAAEALASGIQAEAQQALLLAQSNAELEVADRRRQAEADAAGLREQAKRLLISSQEQAERIIGEAEDHAESLRTTAEQRSKVRNERMQRVSEQHADRVLRFERDAITRLREAQTDLEQAIERLTGSEHSPVLDLSGAQPTVRVGSIEVGAEPPPPPPPDPPAPVSRVRVSERSTERTSASATADPVNRLVRAAVERAVEQGSRDERDAASRLASRRDDPSGATPRGGTGPAASAPIAGSIV